MSELINESTPIKELIIHTDGGSRGNPGHSAVGVVIFNATREHLESFGEYIGITTNNQAEYKAVIEAIKAAEKYQPQIIHFYLDSLLIVNQLKGIYRVKNAELQPLHAEIRRLVGNIAATFEYVPRKQNEMADIEVNKALDNYLADSR